MARARNERSIQNPRNLRPRKRKRKGSAAVDAKVFEAPGKVTIQQPKKLSKASMAGGGDSLTPRVSRTAEDFSPSERAAERKAKRESQPSLGKRLAAIASGVQPGKGKISQAISGGVSGAAIGATIGEAISEGRRKKKKREQS